MSQSRISIIITSPLFQLELKRQLKKRQTRILAIEDTIIDASESGAKLLKDTVENQDIMLPFRVDAGNKALTHLFGRILRQMPSIEAPASTDPADLPYEKRLEREMTFKETTYVPKDGSGAGSLDEPDSGMPPSELLAEAEEDALNDITDDFDNDDRNDGDVVNLPTEDDDDGGEPD